MCIYTYCWPDGLRIMFRVCEGQANVRVAKMLCRSLVVANIKHGYAARLREGDLPELQISYTLRTCTHCCQKILFRVVLSLVLQRG